MQGLTCLICADSVLATTTFNWRRRKWVCRCLYRFFIRELRTNDYCKSSVQKWVRPIFFGRLEARQTFQSRRSAQQLLSTQRSTSSKALMPASTSGALPYPT